MNRAPALTRARMGGAWALTALLRRVFGPVTNAASSLGRYEMAAVAELAAGE